MGTTGSPDDIAPWTVSAAARGDAAAFEAIVRRFERPVFAIAFRLTHDAELARDIAQEVFLRLYRNLERYDPSRPFAPWFLKLATNYALNAREAARLRRASPLEARSEGDADARGLPEDTAAERPSEAAARGEAREAVLRAIGELDARYAGPMALFYLEGLALKDVAERLDLPEGTVKIRLHRAREMLKEVLRRFR